MTGPLLPGHSATVSVPFSALNLGFGQTAFLSKSVLPTGTVDIQYSDHTCTVPTTSGCTLSTQVIDTLTQWTTVIWAP